MSNPIIDKNSCSSDESCQVCTPIDRRPAWDRYPGYRVDLLPCRSVGRVLFEGKVIAQSDACLYVQESEHDGRLYFPEGAVNWEYFEATQHQTFCPFKGDASYWTLKLGDKTLENVVWSYRDPFPEVEGLKGYVSFYTENLKVQLVQSWSGEAGHAVVTTLPIWGDAKDLLDLLDVQPIAERRFVSTPYPNPPIGTFIEQLKGRRRSVVEGGHPLWRRNPCWPMCCAVWAMIWIHQKPD